MTKENKSIKNFPNLRFPEFEGEWKIANLENCAHSFDYGMNASAIKFDGENRYIRITDIDESSSKYKPEFPVSPNGQLLDKYVVSENDILFARTGASTGKSYLYHKDDGKLYFAGFLIRAKIKEEFNSYFVFTQTKTVQYYKWVQLMSMRSGQPGINSQEYATYSFNIPSKNEQDKIASFLLLVDERIQTQKKIIEDLQTSKLSLSNKIFAQKLRFKDSNGKAFPEWSYKVLGEVGEIVNGLTYSPNDINESGVLVLRSSNVHNRILVLNDNVFVKAENFNAVKENDILICVRNGSKNLIGKNTIIKKENEGLAFGAFMSVYRSNYNEFIYQWFDTNDYKEIVKKNLGATINSINGSDLKKFKIPFPSLEEQKKIANFLKYLDDKINLEIGLLNQYENQKKYLLQNLFV